LPIVGGISPASWEKANSLEIKSENKSVIIYLVDDYYLSAAYMVSVVMENLMVKSKISSLI
jgi:nitrogen regulatory protein PII-like uncharacterized protein